MSPRARQHVYLVQRISVLEFSKTKFKASTQRYIIIFKVNHKDQIYRRNVAHLFCTNNEINVRIL